MQGGRGFRVPILLVALATALVAAAFVTAAVEREAPAPSPTPTAARTLAPALTAPAPIASVGNSAVFPVPASIDATCGTSVSPALNAWIASKPDGSTRRPQPRQRREPDRHGQPPTHR